MKKTPIQSARPMTLGELRDTTDVPNQILQLIRAHQVPLILEREDEIEIDNGSGTLITYGNLKGILTAAHVVACTKKAKSKFVKIPYLPVPNSDIVTALKIPFTKIITIDDLNAFEKYSWKETRLDIAIIPIDEENYSILINQGQKKPLDLEKARYQYNANKQLYSSNDHRMLIGAIYAYPCLDIKKYTAIVPLGSHNVYDITEYLYSGPYFGGPIFEKTIKKLKVPTKGYKDLQPDLILMTIEGSEDTLPDDFAGGSGGGLWLISLNETLKIKDLFLGGIFVSTTQDEDGKDCKLYSRGPQSLYEIFCKHLDELIS
jgi:hypothetical protein